MFYRPRHWGDGSEVPSWGTAEETAEIAAKLEDIAVVPAQAETRYAGIRLQVPISSATSKFGAECVSAPEDA